MFPKATTYHDFSLTRGNDRVVFVTWEDSNSPIIPIINNPDAPQRRLFDFPEDSEFRFNAFSKYLEIEKEGEYDPETRELKLVFLPEDTDDVTKDLDMDYEINVTYPTGEKYTILMGKVYVETRRGLDG